ncbi:DNA-binding transcriptional ArsR family regulator [Streptococcus rupicaprae]|uniref:DNA-binding transcriptional ArsR family regulator n=1 Tax=Streptococcus rupicaprae TaxID=759619 RepID=A0ABV2FH49_9STRE
MSVEKTVSEIADILGISRQAINNRVKSFPEEFVDKNDKGVTVVNRAGLIELEKIYQKTIFEDEPISEETKQRELMEILVDEKNAEIVRLYDQLKIKDEQIAAKDEQIRIKDIQISEKDKQLDQQQQLTLKAMADKETLKLELDQAKAQAEEVQVKKGFWAKLFGK